MTDDQKKALLTAGIIGGALVLVWLLTRPGPQIITDQQAQDQLPQTGLEIPPLGYTTYNIPGFSISPINPLGPSNYDLSMPDVPVMYFPPLVGNQAPGGGVPGADSSGGCCNSCDPVSPNDTAPGVLFAQPWIQPFQPLPLAVNQQREPVPQGPNIDAADLLPAALRIGYLSGAMPFQEAYNLSRNRAPGWF